MIHPTAIIGPNVKLGKNVKIGPYCVVNDCEIGDNVYLSSFVSIGEETEHSSEKWEINPRDYKGRIVIGNNVVLREFVTVNKPMAEITFIGDHTYVMARGHISHDTHIEEHAVISNCAILSGWTRVMRGANLGICTATHQFSTIGHYAMIAANAVVVKDVPPLCKYIPNKPLGINSYAIRKWKLPLTEATLLDDEFYKSLSQEWEERRHKERPAHQF